jgi:hypothetical protein
MMQREYFDQLLQEMLKQQQMWEQLKEENWWLRRQLTDLRAAQGMVLVIEGKRFVLTQEADESAPTTEPVAVPIAPLYPSATTSERIVQAEEQTVPRLPRREEMTSNTVSCEETRPMALRPGSAAQEEPAHQEAKAALHRELAGSFLLAHEE